MIAWAVEIVFYAALAIWATRISRRHPVVLIGLMLILCSVISNMAYFGGTFYTRLTLEILQAGAVAVIAKVVFRSAPAAPAAIVTGFAALDVAFCGALAISTISDGWRGVALGWFSNGVFAVQCGCVAYPGVRDALARRRHSRANYRRLDNAHLSFNDQHDQGPEQ
jgi:peptidoglycan/LPS O-acetylase OafA/YrhL